MRVSPDLKNSVCFLCGKNPDGTYHYGGTAFFVAAPSEYRQDVGYLYLVTAKHNIDNAKSEGYYNFHLRMNTLDGGADFVEISDDWRYTDDEVADVAVLPISVSSKFVVTAMPMEMILADDASIQSLDVGIGDDIRVIGLFTERTGSKRNIPIVRSRIIAAMPEEPIEDKYTRHLYDAYLVEIRSIGGLSGSPVLVFKAAVGGYTQFGLLPLPMIGGFLLGLIRGHWDVKPEEVLADFPNTQSERLNTGIAIVTPIREALSIINGDELVKERRRLDKLRAAQIGNA